MRKGWNPTRRNRNIGTSKQGQGQNNQLVIPKSWPGDRVFWEVLHKPIAIQAKIGECKLTFLVEPPRPECFYPCTVADVMSVLEYVPQSDLEGLELIIFRQPTRKQDQLNPVWGRFLYYATPRPHSGTAICIEAHNLNTPLRWSLSLGPDARDELTRLEADGHRIEKGRRDYTIHRTDESVRNTILFRTLFHELGHYVDWRHSVVLPSLDTTSDAEDERLRQKFDSQPSQDKEAFAHRYAQNLATQLHQAGHIPFKPQPNEKALLDKGLKPVWFTPNLS
ncbi:ImmA/IrrE family metallo-endopeptidase [Acaryochloris marina]|uniref:Uncharacterized protein n=1 Tax=Acaryochloris marina (strain MBIC 11017) TaxID=329726 RepID=B0CAJ7_ACAM1|nr:hypothetical protein [Acaryochloris marina]ABW29063.1 hypothetical protein AM1_4082 [Acaryochloris marina MBIC11017]